jgi:hypothetical protein
MSRSRTQPGRAPVPRLAAVAALLLAGSAFAAEKAGSISGTLDKSAGVKAVRVIDRNADADPKKAVVVHDARYDPATGKFVADGLPLPRVEKDDTGEHSYNGVYDLQVVYESGAVLEGVNLKVPRSDYVEEQPLAADDPEKLKALVKRLSKFEDTFDFLAVEGNIQHAAVLVSKLRTQPFYDSQPGEVTWRVEVYRFEKPEDHWVKRQEDLFVVHVRERLQKADYEKRSRTFDPALGGLALSADKRDLTLLDTISAPDPKPGVRLRGKKDEPRKP